MNNEGEHELGMMRLESAAETRRRVMKHPDAPDFDTGALKTPHKGEATIPLVCMQKGRSHACHGRC